MKSNVGKVVAKGGELVDKVVQPEREGGGEIKNTNIGSGVEWCKFKSQFQHFLGILQKWYLIILFLPNIKVSLLNTQI